MKRTRNPSLIVAIFAALFCGVVLPAYGNPQDFTKFTLEGDVASLGSSHYGWLGGVGYRWYLWTSPVSFGLSAFFGTPTGNPVSQDSLVYAGVPLHVDGNLSKLFVYDLGILAAYGQGELNSSGLKTDWKGWLLQESVGIGVVLGGGWRLSFSPGYLYSFTNSSFTGFTFGIRLERKTLNNWSGRDE